MHNLILKYCKGNYTNEELVKATKLFKSEENDIAIAEVMQLQWNLCDNSEIGDKAEFDRILNQVHSIINLDAAQPSATKRFFIGLSRIAAILAIPLILSVFLLLHHNQSKNRLDAENTITVPKGAIKQLRLSDGTLVWLNSGSSLAYKGSFNKTGRDVTLEGEAYFEVTKNPQKPFIVHTDKLSVKVLGTKFDVKSYREDPKVNVTLMEGSVHLSDTKTNPSPLCLLKPNQQASLNKNLNQLTISSIDASNSNEWIRGGLLFDDEELEQIARSLEREYNVTIQIKNSEIKHLRFYGKFKKSQPIEEILDIVSARQNFHYTKKGDLITFSNNH